MVSSDGEQRVDVGELRAFATEVFRWCGMNEADAGLLADSLVDADLSAVHSHGVLRIPEYIKKLRGGVDPQGRPTITRDSGACFVVDGGNSMGQIGATFAMQTVIARAATTGIAAAAIGGSNHCGAMGYFAMQAIAHDMIGIATTNALPVMAPWGGAEALLGINPLGVAIPAGEEPPIVYDAAFAGAAHGKIRIYQQKGMTLPEGWALDSSGNPTTDPAAAIHGLLLPIGGFKGAGLAMVMGILSTMLSGAAYGTELRDPLSGVKPGHDGHFVAAIRISAFEDVALFKSRVDAAIRQTHACRLAPGYDRVYVPGEKEHLTRHNYRRDGVPLNGVLLATLAQAAHDCAIDPTPYSWIPALQ